MPFRPPRRTPGAEVLIRRQGRELTVLSKLELGEVELPPSYVAPDGATAAGFHYEVIDTATGTVEFTGIINDPTGVTVEIPLVDQETNGFAPFRKTRDDLQRPHYFTLLIPDIPGGTLRVSSPDMARVFRMDPDVAFELPIEPPRRRNEPDEAPAPDRDERKGKSRGKSRGASA